MHSEDSWLPFGPGEDVWHDEDTYLTSRPERLRRWGMIGGIVFLGLVIAAGGGAFGADAYATHAICGAVGATGPARTPDGAPKDPAVALDKARKTLDDTAALLLFHPDLRDATRGLARDLADMRLLQTAEPAASTGRLLLVGASVDHHARQAQAACGLPAKGLLHAAAATPPPEPVITPAPTPAVKPTANAATAAAVTPRPSSVRTTHRTPTPASSTPEPTYAATASDLQNAERMVAITARRDHLTLVSPTASAVERQVASYEHAAARQHLADLRAGTPNRRHHDLDVRGAQARLAAAEEDYRRAMIDPAASALDRSQARAVVEQWNETLTRLGN